jgi:hypothetical protein
MKFLFVIFSLLLFAEASAQRTWSMDNLWPEDWLVNKPKRQSEIIYNEKKNEITLYNGLVKRIFPLSPNVACIDYKNMMNGQQLLRAVSPEARLTINGREFNVGGLHGQKEKAYLRPEWVKDFKTDESDFRFVKFEKDTVLPFINWQAGSWWAMNKKQASGARLILYFNSVITEMKGVVVKVVYEIYDGLPLICKWVEVTNNNSNTIKLDKVVNEILATVEEESAVVGKPEQMKTQQGIYIETNYAFNNAMRYSISDQTTHWKTDSSYTSQVNYNYETPCILEVYPDKAPGIELRPGENFISIRTYELLMDSYDRERRGLAIRKMYSAIAPWTTMNPIFMHLVSKNDEEVKNAIDQCTATGYEALILSFGSHLNMEDSSIKNIQRWKSMADYAHGKGIMIGGYSLFSSRRISDEDDVINPKTGKPGGAFFGNAPCFGSKWGLAYRDKIKYFFTQTGFNLWENDGPYPGDVCASTLHPGHKGLDDSQWKQMEIQKELYKWLNEKGVYINAPDWYFLDGTHKIAIGYREVNFSLSREQQKILNRQNIFDGTWEKTPSMGWGFVPLTKYQGGGPEAILEPLSEHLKDYEQLMMQYYGAGVQACYRGPRLYDTEETKQTVIKVINWYKKYREILNSDIIHLRRADGRDWDGWLHVHPSIKYKGLAMFFNPLKERITRKIKLPLYYTGLKDEARLSFESGKSFLVKLNRKYEIEVTISLEAESYTYLLIQ